MSGFPRPGDLVFIWKKDVLVGIINKTLHDEKRCVVFLGWCGSDRKPDAFFCVYEDGEPKTYFSEVYCFEVIRRLKDCEDVET